MIADQNGSEATEVIRLFPTFVWSNGLRPAAHEPIHAAVLGVLRDLRRELPPPAVRPGSLHTACTGSPSWPLLCPTSAGATTARTCVSPAGVA
jgi:hypothetical protein